MLPWQKLLRFLFLNFKFGRSRFDNILQIIRIILQHFHHIVDNINLFALFDIGQLVDNLVEIGSSIRQLIPTPFDKLFDLIWAVLLGNGGSQ